MDSEKRSYNLCSTYMLPLVGLNKKDFGVGAFMNSYISEDNRYMIVEFKGRLSIVVVNQNTFRFQFTKDEKDYAVFEVPETYIADMERFRAGKYSVFSSQAKHLIRTRSGLVYRLPLPGQAGLRTAVELMVLDKDNSLRENMERKLDVKIDKDAELGSIPGPDNFFNLQLSTKLEMENC